MQVYRQTYRDEQTADKLKRLARLCSGGDAASLLVELGELEQAALDAGASQQDGWGSQEERFREVMLAAGSAYLAEQDGRHESDQLVQIQAVLEDLGRVGLPATLRVRPPEGYVHYALDPAAYRSAARAYRTDVGSRRAMRAVVVGVRSIGTSLSAVVAAEVGSQRRVTLRPRGVSGERKVVASAELERLLVEWSGSGEDVLIVDEGPGATGETFEVVAGWLRSIGLSDGRVVLFPSRVSGMQLAPEARRQWFASARKHPPLGLDTRPLRIADVMGLEDLEDLSGGRWREVVPGAASQPANVGHERRKYLGRDRHGDSYLIRYAGLGRWGEAVAARATVLAETGQGAEVAALRNGFLVCRWREGSAALWDARLDSAFFESLANYLCTRARAFRTGSAVEITPLVQMLAENASEAFNGAESAGLAAAMQRLERLPPREAVVPDARLARREWVRTSPVYAKVDALDHGDGLRLPGLTDQAWDLAGASLEFALDGSTLAALVCRVAASADQSAAELAAAVAAYRAPYAALGLGEVSLSAWEASGLEDRCRLEAEARRYRRLLAVGLVEAAVTTPLAPVAMFAP